MHSHSHDHHDHSHQANRLSLALAVTLGFAAVEAVGGWLAHSLALLGDAGHMVTDATALGFAALAARLAQRPATFRLSYGLGRAEVLAAVVNAFFMLAVVVGILVAAVQRIRAPEPVQGATVMVIAAIGLTINLVVLFILSRGEHNLNTRGALLHVAGDLLGSVAALIAGAVVYWTGWTPIDPLLSILICLILLYSSVALLREATHVLMEGVPPHLDLPEVGKTMAAVTGVHSVHDLHIWTLSSGQVALSAHVVIPDLASWEEILGRLQHELNDRYGIDHITLQPEAGRPPVARLRPMHGPPG